MLEWVAQNMAGVKVKQVVVQGIPLDENSSFMRGPALAPTHIRAALAAGAMNWCTEAGLDLATLEGSSWSDVGDLNLTEVSGLQAILEIERGTVDLLAKNFQVLSLGGDHSVTYPILKAYAPKYPQITILHFDAHPDLYHDFEGNPFSHASPFARIMEEKLASRLIQVGIRTMNPHQCEQVERFGVEVIEMRNFKADLPVFSEITGPVYLSLDLDALDPAFAPGVSHYEPGGLSTRDILSVIQTLSAPIIGADIVEFNPTRDPAGVTAMVAAKFYKEFIGQMLQSPHQ